MKKRSDVLLSELSRSKWYLLIFISRHILKFPGHSFKISPLPGFAALVLNFKKKAFTSLFAFSFFSFS
jgi:hypothetical protein